MYCPLAAKGFTACALLRAQWIFIEAYLGPMAALLLMQIRQRPTACRDSVSKTTVSDVWSSSSAERPALLDLRDGQALLVNGSSIVLL